MSTINVTNLRGGMGSPNLPDGAVITGVATATTFDGANLVVKSTGFVVGTRLQHWRYRE